jgi:hypothetical protein
MRMKRHLADIDRLLRSAARAPEDATPEAPFGFATRVVAVWRSGESGNDVTDITRFLRRTGAIAFIVLVLAGVGAYRQVVTDVALSAPQTNEYAIADSAIQTEFSE